MGDRGSFGGRESSDGTTTTKPNADVNASSGLNLQGTSASTSESVPQNGEMLTMPGGFVGQMPNMGEIPEGFDPTQMPEDFDPPQKMPGGSWGFNMNGMGNAASSSTNLIWLAVSVLVLGVGLIVVKLYKKY